MDINHDERSPTIGEQLGEETPAKSSFTPRRERISLKALRNAVIARIKRTQDLYQELPFMQGTDEKRQKECMEVLAKIISHYLIDREEWNAVLHEKNMAKDLSKKTKKRWRHRDLQGSNKAKQLEKFVHVAVRDIMAREMAESTPASLIKEQREYYPRLKADLYDFFSMQTPRPHKYINAIIGLFNLHPRLFCCRCSKMPKSRKQDSQRKIQSLTQRIRRGTDMCKLENIFECPNRRY